MTLTLRPVSAVTTTFSDRPERDSGTITTAEFVSSFDQAFGDDPPNATVSSLERGRGEFTVELSDPRYEKATRTLTYAVRPIGAEGSNFPGRLGPVSVFIDDATSVTVHGRVTDDCTDAATLPGATVRITATDSDSDSVTTITDSAGDYQVTDTFDQTEPYVVTVTMDGFEPAQKETQFPDSDNELDFVLTLEAASLPDYAGC